MTDTSAETNLVDASQSELFSDLKPAASRRPALAEFPVSVRLGEVARLVATAAPVAKPRVPPPPPDLGLFSVEPSDPESGVSMAAPLVGHTDPLDVQAASSQAQLESISHQFDTEWDDWQLTEQQLELPAAIRALPPPLRAAPTVPPAPPVPGLRSVLPPVPKPPESFPAASLQPLPPLPRPPSTTLKPPRCAMPTMPAMRAFHHPITPRPNARVALALGTVFGLIVLLVVVGIVSSVGGGSGSLVVTVSGPGSRAVSGIEVLVDGEGKCVSSPCRVEPLAAGTHLVKVRGRGFQETASLAVAVNAGAASALHIPLARPVDNRPAPDALVVTEPKPLTAQTARAAEVPVMQLESAPVAAETQKAVTHTEDATRPRAMKLGKLAVTEPARAAPIEAKPAEGKPVTDAPSLKGFGMLRISSLPAVTVAVDGRPVGTTPKVVRVAAGSHRVAFFGKEGRRTQTVNVAAGASQAVTAKF